VENGFLPVHHQGVAGIVAALKAHDYIGVLGKKIDDLPFALVSPLGAYDRDVGHLTILDFGLPILDSNLKSKI
jgi:hypothetical protein